MPVVGRHPRRPSRSARSVRNGSDQVGHHSEGFLVDPGAGDAHDGDPLVAEELGVAAAVGLEA
jgi:hypothetical protein